MKVLPAKIGELTLANDFFAGALGKADCCRAQSDDRPFSRSAGLTSGAAARISRGSIYYLSRPVSSADLALMRWIDELHMTYPFAGSKMLRDLPGSEGVKVGRFHVTTLMKKMGIAAIYRRPNTSKPAQGHRIYPVLLRKLAVTRPNQVWATDISYVPTARGFVYLEQEVARLPGATEGKNTTLLITIVVPSIYHPCGWRKIGYG